MHKKKTLEDNLTLLRRRAEKTLQGKPTDNLELTELSNEKMHSLIHELQVHQIELEMQNEELRRTQYEIEDSRKEYAALYDKYCNLYDFAPVGYFTTGKKATIKEANITGASLLGIDRQSLIGKPLTRFISRQDQDTFYLHYNQVLKKNSNHLYEIKMNNYDNTPFHAQLESIAVRGEDGNATQVRTAITDVSDRKMIDQRLQASLREKEVLLQEVHHRVKNNMQIILSLINLQCEKIEDKSICDMFNETADRVNSMALVHKQLYKSKDFSRIDFHKYINRVAQNLLASHGVDTTKISLKIDKSDISLNLESAVSCGLILNELITNSLKYAFPENRKGEIRVELGNLGDGQLEMRVSDDGVGIPENFDVKDADTLGIQIVNAIAEHQLGGTLSLDTTKGTKITIQFKEPSQKGFVSDETQDPNTSC